MVNGINDFITNLISSSACSEMVAIITISLIALLFLLAFILSLVKIGYSLEKRQWFNKLTYMLSAVTFVFFGVQASFSYFVLIFVLILQTIISLIRTKNIKVTKSHKRLINEIDEVKEQYLEKEKENEKNDHFNANEILHRLKTVPQPTEQEKLAKECVDLDFSHVKAVIDKLDYYSLSQSDRRVVNELEINLLHAEKGEIYPDTKSKINDGLGALLKIMSKYGV